MSARIFEQSGKGVSEETLIGCLYRVWTYAQRRNVTTLGQAEVEHIARWKGKGKRGAFLEAMVSYDLAAIDAVGRVHIAGADIHVENRAAWAAEKRRQRGEGVTEGASAEAVDHMARMSGGDLQRQPLEATSLPIQAPEIISNERACLRGQPPKRGVEGRRVEDRSFTAAAMPPAAENELPAAAARVLDFPFVPPCDLEFSDTVAQRQDFDELERIEAQRYAGHVAVLELARADLADGTFSRLVPSPEVSAPPVAVELPDEPLAVPVAMESTELSASVALEPAALLPAAVSILVATAPPADAQALLEAIFASFRDSERSYGLTYLEALVPKAIVSDTLVLGIEDPFWRDWITDHYGNFIDSTLAQTGSGLVTHARIEVDEALAEARKERERLAAVAAEERVRRIEQSRQGIQDVPSFLDAWAVLREQTGRPREGVPSAATRVKLKRLLETEGRECGSAAVFDGARDFLCSSIFADRKWALQVFLATKGDEFTVAGFRIRDAAAQEAQHGRATG